MKKIVHDFLSTNEEEVRDQTLMTNATRQHQAFDEWNDLVNQEEAHYVHTINAFVELIVLYGWAKVIGDLRQAMGEKEW